MEELDDVEGKSMAAAIMMVYFAPGKSYKMTYSPEIITSSLNPSHISTRNPKIVDGQMLLKALNDLKIRSILKRLFVGLIYFVRVTSSQYQGYSVIFNGITRTGDDTANAFLESANQLAAYILQKRITEAEPVEEAEPTTEVRARGRPALSYEELYKFRAATLRKERNAATKDAEDMSVDDDEEMSVDDMWEEERKDISACLIDLMQRAAVFKNMINDHDQLSISAGLCLLELQGTVRISSEKIPMAANIFLNMWFGSALDYKTRELFCPSSETNDRAVCRAAAAERTLRSFQIADTDANNSSRIIGMSLMMDEGNKKGHDMKAKLGNSISAAGEVCRQSFDTDVGITKVTDPSAKQTFESLLKELGKPAIFLITSICSDWFANGAEARKVGKAIDDLLLAEGEITQETHPNRQKNL